MEKVLDRMRNLCSRREYCRSDIMKKVLKALDGDRTGAEKITETLVREKYIDELRYSSAFARDKASIAGWGETKIRYMLSAKGIRGRQYHSHWKRLMKGKLPEGLKNLWKISSKASRTILSAG